MDANLRNYYIYMYYDPRPGKLKEGIYVGIGKEKNFKRPKTHVINSQLKIKKVGNGYGCNTLKIHLFKKIKRETGEFPPYVILCDNLTKQEAIKLEVWLIWAIGRRDLKLGPLTNMTDGGEGTNGCIPSKVTRRKLSIASKGRKHTKEAKDKISKANKGKIRSEEQRKRISEAKKGTIVSLESRKKRSEHMSIKSNNPSYDINVRKKISEALKGRVFSEAHKQRISKSKKGVVSSFSRWQITYPDGSIVIIENLKDFCRENDLNYSSMKNMVRVKPKQGHHKGFKCEKIEKTEELAA